MLRTVLGCFAVALAGCTAADPVTPAVDTAQAPSVGTPAAGDTLPVSMQTEVQRVRLNTTKGDIILEVHPEWAPRGAERFLTLVREDFYDGVKFFRVVSGFMVQTGINGDPQTHAKWKDRNLQDDPTVQSNTRGYVTFAHAGPNSRSTQFFINLADNSRLDNMRPAGFAPFAKVVEGMDVVDQLYAGYGDGPPSGRGPNQGQIVNRGNAYLEERFPKLDAINSAEIITAAGPSGSAAPVDTDTSTDPAES